MARYIDLEKLEKRIKKNIKPEIPEEKAFLEWCKDECIRQAYAMPTEDVVPRSEVESVLDELMKDLQKRQKQCGKEAKSHGWYLEMRRECEGESEGLEYCLEKLAELKKKYTEGAADNGSKQ